MLKFSSSFVLLNEGDVDTDQIIPARFLTTTERQGLGAGLFADWRQNPAFVLNQAGASEAKVLVAGANFGCGSSREHAPWALLDFGFKAVLSTRFADIFRSNALKNGLLPVVISDAAFAWLKAHPEAHLTIDLDSQTVVADGFSESFEVEPFARYRLMNGVDELGFILNQHSAISQFEANRA